MRHHQWLVLPLILVLSLAGCSNDTELSANDPGSSALTAPAGKGVIEISRCEPMGCRVTGGGVDQNGNWDGRLVKAFDDRDRYQFGGQAGANTALPPEPAGEWTHHQQRGASGSFVFHAGTSSAPDGTAILLINCRDDLSCDPARPAPAKQIDFWGIGTFKNMTGAPPIIADNVIVGESLHYFEVNIDDAGEGGNTQSPHNSLGSCPDQGFGLRGGAKNVDCDCPDFYRITIYADETPTTVIYQVYGYIKGGNLQIHPLTGYDSK